jgi:sulfatase maturation enzyme AslB (radical SAM superfamily)
MEVVREKGAAQARKVSEIGRIERDMQDIASFLNLRALVLILTAQCNLQCSYCYQNAKKPKKMDWETLQASIDVGLRSTRRVTELLFLGGEPLMEFPLIRNAVEYADMKSSADQRIKFAISTNGTLLTDEILSFLVQNDFKIQLSFDGVRVMQDLRSDSTFDNIDGLLERFRTGHPEGYRKNLKVSITAHPRGVTYLADSVEYLMEKGIAKIGISPILTPDPSWTNAGIEDLQTQFERIYAISRLHQQRTGEVPLLWFGFHPGRRSIRPPDGFMCNTVRCDTPVVDADGQVYVCALLALSYQDYRSPFWSGRLKGLRVGTITDPDCISHQSNVAKAVREAGIFTNKEHKYSSYGRCYDCDYYDRCSICPASIIFDSANTDPDRIPDFPCAFYRVALQYRDRFLGEATCQNRGGERTELEDLIALLESSY